MAQKIQFALADETADFTGEDCGSYFSSMDISSITSPSLARQLSTEEELPRFNTNISSNHAQTSELKRKIYLALHPKYNKYSSKYFTLVNLFLTLCVLLSVVNILISTIPSIAGNPQNQPILFFIGKWNLSCRSVLCGYIFHRVFIKLLFRTW